MKQFIARRGPRLLNKGLFGLPPPSPPSPPAPMKVSFSCHGKPEGLRQLSAKARSDDKSPGRPFRCNEGPDWCAEGDPLKLLSCPLTWSLTRESWKTTFKFPLKRVVLFA